MRVCVVADRGMISAETMAELEARRLPYILGVRERADELVRELVLDDPAGCRVGGEDYRSRSRGLLARHRRRPGFADRVAIRLNRT